MIVRRFLDVITDILILVALAVAGVGHFLPWFEIEEKAIVESASPDAADGDAADDSDAEAGKEAAKDAAEEPLGEGPSALDFQVWYAARSGIALAVAALLVGTSLTLNLGVGTRKLLVLLMFGSVLVALAFQAMIWTPFPITETHRQLAGSNWHLNQQEYLLALVSSAVAGALCLVRMAWTMTASPKK